MSNKSNKARERILMLMDKFHQGVASDEDIREIDQWYASFSGDEKYTEGLSTADQARIKDELLRRIHTEVSQIASEQGAGQTQVENRKVANLKATNQKTFFGYRLVAAVLVVLALSIGVYWYNNYNHASRGDTTPLAENQIQPGSNKAVLTLADGSKISLTNAANGQLVEGPGIVIAKEDDGHLVYQITESIGETNSEPVYNTLSTPIGGQYQVRLPDGTKVWLNAASSLTYPTSFAAIKERRVILNGEAYFEVASNKHLPFVVKTKQQEITVTGTHFNVRSYGDETREKTTLIEGAVTVNAGSSNENLKPGQEAIVEEGIQVADADTDAAIAWKNGDFRFKDETIEEIMRKLSRWYGIEVRYEGAISDEGYNGKISRSKSINQVLNMLEKTREVHFKIEGRRVTVME